MTSCVKPYLWWGGTLCCKTRHGDECGITTKHGYTVEVMQTVSLLSDELFSGDFDIQPIPFRSNGVHSFGMHNSDGCLVDGCWRCKNIKFTGISEESSLVAENWWDFAVGNFRQGVNWCDHQLHELNHFYEIGTGNFPSPRLCGALVLKLQRSVHLGLSLRSVCVSACNPY